MAAWIFKGNPKNFDIRGAVRELGAIDWRVQQHRDKIQDGDRVYILESGPRGGVVAVATVTGRPRPYDPWPVEGRFVRDSAFMHTATHFARVHIEALVGRLSRLSPFRSPMLAVADMDAAKESVRQEWRRSWQPTH